MGTCYSCQARIGKSTYPSDMSLNSSDTVSSKKGSAAQQPRLTTNNAFNHEKSTSSRLRPPSSTSLPSHCIYNNKPARHHSNSSSERLNTSGESGIVLTVENTSKKYKKLQNNSNNAATAAANQRRTEPTSGGPRRGKFGFQSKSRCAGGSSNSAGSGGGGKTNGHHHHFDNSDANRNLMDASSDSLESIDSRQSAASSASDSRGSSLGRAGSSLGRAGSSLGRAGSSLGRGSKKNLTCCVAYNPKEGGRWKMIDDSESTDTRSVSTQGRSEHDLARDRNGNSLCTPTHRSQGTSGSVNSSSSNNSNKFGGGSHLKKPQSRLKAPPTTLNTAQNRLGAQKQSGERQWVKAGPMDMDETTSASSVDRAKCEARTGGSNNIEGSPASNANSKKRRGFFAGRGRGRLQFGGGGGGGDRNTNDNDNKQAAVTDNNKLVRGDNKHQSLEDNKNVVNVEKHVTPDSGLGGECMVEDEISKAVGNMLDSTGGENKKDVKETINVLSKDMSAAVSLGSDLEADLETDGANTSLDSEMNRLCEQLAKQKLDSSNEQKLDSSNEQMLDDIDAYLDEAAPRVRLDSLDSCSIGSFNSDDLMLDCDALGDEFEQSMSCSVATIDKTQITGTHTTKTRLQPRSLITDQLSMSQPTSGLAKLDKRPMLRRPETSGNWRAGSLKNMTTGSFDGGPRERRLRTQSTTGEAVSELSRMMGTSGQQPAIQRRPPKFSRERPASFPGPLNADGAPRAGEPRTIQFRQRGKAPSISDEEQVLVDATTYRAIMQELTDFKTMVFKLKRVIQQEEIGSPFGSHTFAGTLKNGYSKLAGGSGSTPGSPMVNVDCSSSFAFTDTNALNADTTQNQDMLQENAELRQQLAAMQKQLDEQDRTIKLLQQQMTKYECGHFGAEGKVFNNATTQTDKQPRLSVPKNILRPSAGGATGTTATTGTANTTATTGEPVISSKKLPSPRQDHAPVVNGEKSDKPATAAATTHQRPKSQLPVGVGRGGAMGAARASRLPAMRVHRISKQGQPQLQSFSKIAQPQATAQTAN